MDYQKHLKGFIQKQLSYYGEIEEEGLLLNQMQAEISRIRSSYPTSGLLQILHAHIYMLQKKPELAALLLDDAYAGIWKCRQEEPDLYCYYLYVRNLLEEKPEQKNTLEKIVEKYAEEGVSTTLLFMLFLLVWPLCERPDKQK